MDIFTQSYRCTLMLGYSFATNLEHTPLNNSKMDMLSIGLFHWMNLVSNGLNLNGLVLESMNNCGFGDGKMCQT
jgi:hypothetical protein